MIGLVLSLFVGLVLFGLGRQWQDVYRKTTTVLFWWNVAITIFLVMVWWSGTVFIAGLGSLLSGATGFLVGLTGGGLALSALMFLMMLMSLTQTVGVLFLNNALSPTSEGSYEWKKGTLAAGVILFTVGLTRIFG